MPFMPAYTDNLCMCVSVCVCTGMIVSDLARNKGECVPMMKVRHTMEMSIFMPLPSLISLMLSFRSCASSRKEAHDDNASVCLIIMDIIWREAAATGSEREMFLSSPSPVSFDLPLIIPAFMHTFNWRVRKPTLKLSSTCRECCLDNNNNSNFLCVKMQMCSCVLALER
jgi:hypothetical protein